MAGEIMKLQEEHVRFRRLLDLVEQQLNLFHLGDTPDYPLLTDVLHYMINYPDHFHHPKEDVIFAHLGNRDPRIVQKVDELARQHHAIAEAGTRLHENLDSVLNGALMPRRMIEVPGLMYVTYYRSHMDKEESELFRVAETLLRDDDWDRITSETMSSPDPMFGGDIDERYDSVYRRITGSIDDDGVR
jgi:hemerythrin-like domain-containing protein